MYDVGFGDSFLITARGPGRPWHMLVDCGVHTQGVGEHTVQEVVGDIIQTCTDESGRARIDVVVATHRHRDHISGFADERWQDVEVGEVWLPWTEDPKDEQANRIRAGLDAVAMSLGLALDAAGDAEFALNSLSNEDAMWTLREGFAGPTRRRYIASNPMTSRLLKGVTGGRVNFLGPGRDKEMLRRMDPTRAQRWLRLDDSAVTDGDSKPVFPAHVVDEGFVKQRLPHFELEPTLRAKLSQPYSEDPLAAAGWLDQVVNNTSIIMVLRIGDASVLLPGDAQWGAWLPLLEEPDVCRLLRKVVVYKVSHHASHNGTPRSLAEEIFPSSLTSLVSVRGVKRWKHIPKKELVEELQRDGRSLLVSDGSFALPPNARKAANGLWYEIDLPA